MEERCPLKNGGKNSKHIRIDKNRQCIKNLVSLMRSYSDN